jgi:hypothetical protein
MAEGKEMTDQRTRIAARQGEIDPTTVFGWGVDADTRNDPTYPYRDRSADEGLTKDWQRPTQQESDVEILQSIEHVRRPAVFGTSTPPSGISGMLRRLAFRWSESNWIHWLLLMGADRINMVEGVAQDLGRGKVPNIPGEMGARAEWQHNKTGFAIKTVAVLAVTAGIVALIRSRKGGASDTDVQGFGGAARDEEMLHDPKAYRAYDAALGDLGDAGGAPSLGGPAA